MAREFSSPAFGGNITDATIRADFRAWVTARQNRDTETARYRNLCKAIKAHGTDVAVFEALYRMKRQDPRDVLGAHRQFIRYCRIMALPIGSQLSLLGEDLAQPQISDEEEQAQAIWDAGQMGLLAGRTGQGDMDNPFDAGTVACVAWQEGCRRGRQQRADGLVPRRGRPRKLAAIDQAA